MRWTPAATGGEEVPLTGIRAEFRTALLEEIKTAGRHASADAVSLIGGRRIAQIGSAFQYIFNVENPLNLPGDAPADLHVPGFPTLSANVVSVEGLSVTLSVSQDVGQFVPAARLVSDLTFLMRKLIARIEMLADGPNPVGDRMLGLSPVAGSPDEADRLDDRLDDEQRDAVASSLGRNATFIWGPPGTGKTTTIGAISHELFCQNRSVLLVSHTNIAVDQAVLEIGKKVPMSDLAEGRVVRVGVPKNTQLREQPDLLLDTHVKRRSEALAQQRDALQAERANGVAEVLRLSRLIDMCEWVDEASADIDTMTRQLDELRHIEEELGEARNDARYLESFSARWNAALEQAQRAKQATTELSETRHRIARVESALSVLSAEQSAAARVLAEAQALLSRTSSVGLLTRLWRRLPDPEEQTRAVAECEHRLANVNGELQDGQEEFAAAKARAARLAASVEAFTREYDKAPDEVTREVAAHFAALAQTKSLVDELELKLVESRPALEHLLCSRLSVLREWGLTSVPDGTVETIAQAIQEAHNIALAEVEGLELAGLRAQRGQLNRRIETIDEEVASIEDALHRVEELVIADARIVATTLTRAYLRDDIQSRQFDTVILDEASIAPIPALWIAASRAEHNAVVVGDWKQLPPIVLSNHELAKRWLGRDVFEAASIRETTPPHLVKLRKQYRMHPDVSAIPNALVYDGMLNDDDGCRNDGDLSEWYAGHPDPVLLVDTGSLGAWVTSVPRGDRASRLNFLSATVCVDLAERMLKPGIEPLPGGGLRILIVCPYQAHAKLLKLLLEERSLTNFVEAGTVHSFQGTEAAAVIFDLVNDEPHWKVAMFNPKRDPEVMPILNVALTRARRRLVIVGDFDYIAKLGSKAFVGAHLLRFLLERGYARVDASDLVPAGLSVRAAKAQIAMMGSDDEAEVDRLVCRGEAFYQHFARDLLEARSRIVIYSAFITRSRVAMLEPPLKGVVERGRRVYVVTRAHSDRRKRELPEYKILEQTLRDWGVIVVHKQNMHEKLIFIDNDILWEGSMNALSSTGETGEHMERRRNPRLYHEYAQTVFLSQLVGQCADGNPACPVCGCEVLATEGLGKPFYWCCINDECRYKRDADTPAPVDGLIACSNCGGAVEYGEWGNKPTWRCTVNSRHHQAVGSAHLRLPRMRRLVPKHILSELDKRFGDGRQPRAGTTQRRLSLRSTDIALEG